MPFNPIITVYNGTTPVPVRNADVSSILQLIKSDTTLRTKVAAVRAEPNKEKRGPLKKKLQGVTWSGTFSNRDAKSLIQYSGIVHHDVDNLNSDELQELKSNLQLDPYCLAAFVSPSGNGLKILFYVETPAEDHLQAWTSIGNYLHESYGITPDPSCKDICRLCYLSSDADLYYNDEAYGFDLLVERDQEPEHETPALPAAGKNFVPVTHQRINPGDHTDRFLQICHDTTIKKVQPVEGSFNKYINVFAMFANRYGISENDCAWAAAANCGFAEPDKDDRATVHSTYAKFAAERGKWKADYLAKKGNDPKAEKPAKYHPKKRRTNTDNVDDRVKFWYTATKYNAKGEPVIDPSTQQPKTEYELSYDNGIDFLQNNGFYKLKEGDGYALVRVDETNNQIDAVLDLRLKEFMLDYLRSRQNDEFRRVRELFRRKVGTYCSAEQFAGLEYYKPTFKKDTQKQAYVYFNNCYFEITAENVEQKQYSDLEGFIWKKQVIDHAYKPVEWHGCDFHKFIIRAVIGKAVDNEQELDETDRKKYDAAITGIGYMLHKYKDPGVTKAVVAVDRKTRKSSDEMNGGSGKSMYGKAIGKMINALTIDGQNFKFDDQFALQGVSPDTQLINFNDVGGTFKFQRMFGMLTEGLTYRGLYKNSVTLAYEESPKAYISTNLIIMGDGDSFRRRQHLLEFSDYFNEKHTPAKEFGRMFFSGWDDAEWNRFYAFFIHCIQEFLRVGLVDFPIENYNMRKLLEWHKGAGVELNDYLNETIAEQLKHVQEHVKKDLLDGFVSACPLAKDVQPNTFTKMVQLWAKIHGLEINAHKNGERDRRNSKEYLRFTPIPQDDQEQPEQTQISNPKIDML